MEYYFSFLEYGPFCIKCTLYIFELLRRRSLLLIKWHTVYWYIIYIESYLLMSFLKMFSMSWIALKSQCYCIRILYDFVDAYVLNIISIKHFDFITFLVL